MLSLSLRHSFGQFRAMWSRSGEVSNSSPRYTLSSLSGDCSNFASNASVK